MKKLLFIFLAFPMMGCRDDDAAPIVSYTPINETFTGRWELRNVSGGIAGTSDDFSPGEILWVIDPETHTVQVTNTNPDPNDEDFFDSGLYPYQIVINPATPEICGFNLEIGGVNLGCFTVSENEFKLSMIEADGHVLTLRRPQNLAF